MTFWVVCYALLIPLGYIAPNYSLPYSIIVFQLTLAFLPLPGRDIFAHYIPYLDGDRGISFEPFFESARNFNLWMGGDSTSFLAVNSILTLVIVFYSFNRINKSANKYIATTSFSLFCFISGLTIIYHSPRSALPFAISFLAITLSEARPILAILASLIPPFFHLQYAISSLVLFIYTSKHFFVSVGLSHRFKLGKLTSASLIFLALALMAIFVRYLPFVLSFLSNDLGSRASVKLNYLSGEFSTYRLTSSLTLITACLPLVFSTNSAGLMPGIRRYLEIFQRFPVLRYLALSSAGFQILFFNSPHVAGRLARTSDYILIPLLFSCLIPPPTNKNIIASMSCMTAVIVFSLFIYKGVFFSSGS